MRSAAALLPLMLTSCFVGDEGPPPASESQVRQALKNCKVVHQSFEYSQEQGQFEVTLYKDEPAAAAKLACLDKISDEEMSFAIWNGLPRSTGPNN